jgi:hypothetical protein
MIARFYRPPHAAAFAGTTDHWRRRWRRFFEQLRRDWREAAAAPDDDARFRDGAERFTMHCQHCREETSHEGVGEVGLGWYAQICRCRRCGHHSVKIWTCW